MHNANGSTEALALLLCLGSVDPEDCDMTSHADWCYNVGNLGMYPRMRREQRRPNHPPRSKRQPARSLMTRESATGSTAI